MHVLRGSKLITSLVLAWFALFLGSAVASSLIEPGKMQVICAAGGAMKLVDMDGNDGELPVLAKMDCPLCASFTAPLPQSGPLFVNPSALAHALTPIAAVHIAALTAPPLPSRGPPAAS